MNRSIGMLRIKNLQMKLCWGLATAKQWVNVKICLVHYHCLIGIGVLLGQMYGRSANLSKLF